MVKEIESYSKVWGFGHTALAEVDLFDGDIVVQEKIDGSQFSFGRIDGELFCRSKRVMIDLDDPGMFAKAVAEVQERQDELLPGIIYRGEFVSKPKHNTLTYDRTPEGFIIGYDVLGHSGYVNDPIEVRNLFNDLGLETVPLFYYGPGADNNRLDGLKAYLERKPALGGEMIEGIVIKNYGKFDPSGKVAMAKIVSADFQEKHQTSWRERNPSGKDVVGAIAEALAHEVRWQKSVNRLVEEGKLTRTPRDIGGLIKEVKNDLLDEEADQVKDALFKHFWPQIAKRATNGLPEWYKRQLIEQAFGEGGD